jgi:hypothetical protein
MDSKDPNFPQPGPGVVQPPKEPEPQMKKPLIQENMKEGDDVRNVYNPDKQPNPSVTLEKKNQTNKTALATDIQQDKALSLNVDGQLYSIKNQFKESSLEKVMNISQSLENNSETLASISMPMNL